MAATPDYHGKTTLMPDWLIRQFVVEHNMITNFVERQKQAGVFSYGLDGSGYDIRLQEEYRHMTPRRQNLVLDPKDPFWGDDGAGFEPRHAGGGKILIEPHSVVRVASVEAFNMPRNVTAVSSFGKSSYGRNGLFPIAAPIDRGYSGSYTFTIVNPFPIPAIVYANEGVAQMLFYLTDLDCEKDYADKGGKYQGSSGVAGTTFKQED